MSNNETPILQGSNLRLLIEKNYRKIIIVFFMLIILPCSIILGIYYEIYELLSVSAIILGWFLATNSINTFQRNNLETGLRDKLFQEFKLTALSGADLMMAWNEWSSMIKDETRFYYVTNRLWNMVLVSQTFVNQLINNFQLDVKERALLEKIISITEEWTTLVNQSLAEKNTSIDMRIRLETVSKKFQMNLQLILYIIQLSDFG